MCRMLAAPAGFPGHLLDRAFLRMARGENVETEKNRPLGLLRHGDGWGAVLRGTERLRSERPCWDDASFQRVRLGLVELLHARLASRGTVGEANAHPFTASVRGETWSFCHNGTLLDEPDDGSGSTDSERFFRRIMTFVERGKDPVRAFELAASRLKKITAANAFLLGPKSLSAFCVFADPECPSYYTLSWAETAYGALVSSEPLRDLATDWTPIANGTALVFPVPSGDGAEASPRIVSLRLPAGLRLAGV